MLFIKISLLLILFVFASYRIGLLLNKILKNHNFLVISLYGFIGIVSFLQIIYIPMILLHVSFKTVLYITLCTLILFIAISFLICKDDEIKLLKSNAKKLKNIKKKNVLVICILCLVVLFQATTSSILFNENADDAFYISLVEENKSSDEIYTNAPSLGINNTLFLSRYMVSGYELFLSVISKIFDIESTILAHTVIPFIMIIFSYIAYYIFARKFFNNEKSQIFLLLLSILFLFSGFTTRFRGIILLSRMWQGKEIFLNIVLTLIISNLIGLNKNNIRKSITTLVILNFSAVFFTNTAIFLVPFAYLGFGIITILKKQMRNFLGLLLSGIPIAIYATLYLTIVQNIRGSTYYDVNIFEVFKDYIGTGYFIVLYIISLIIVALKGNKKARNYFLLIPIINLITIYNPIFTNIITKYFTGSEVFWRLFWLLPIEFTIVYAFTIIAYLKKNRIYQITVILIEILLIVMSGKFVYTKQNGFEKPENLNKIPQVILEQTRIYFRQK